MTVPNRTYQSPEYRYGFQGQEKDDEIKGNGNSINYKYRMHDPRVGRFFAVDPLSRLYSWNSSYAFSENRVIDGVELEGLEVYLKTASTFIHKDDDNKAEYAGKVITNMAIYAYNSGIGLWNYAGDLTNPNDIWDLQYGKDKFRIDVTNAKRHFKEIYDFYDDDPNGLKSNMLTVSLKHDLDPKNFKIENLEKAGGEALLGQFSITRIAKITKAIPKPGAHTAGVAVAGVSGMKSSLKWLKKYMPNDPKIINGCEKVATKINKEIGGIYLQITNKINPNYFLGPVNKIVDTHNWKHHVAAIKDGKVFDHLTGKDGMLLENYKKMFDYADDLNFDILDKPTVK